MFINEALLFVNRRMRQALRLYIAIFMHNRPHVPMFNIAGYREVPRLYYQKASVHKIGNRVGFPGYTSWNSTTSHMR